MSYKVLARKYRPQVFDEVYAQEHITTVLKNAISMNRLAHAFLFTGTRGVGKTSMARILAKSLNCMEGMSPNPCNKCDNCVEITNGNSTDVVEIDGASNTGVEDIRDLQKELMYSTSKSAFKIFIIDEVHMLSKNAFNALLKTLEEPPEQVIFIFATTEPHKIIPTIISRCQRYDFKKIPIDLIVKRLDEICRMEEIEIEKEALYIVAKKADGSMRDASSLMDQLIALSKDRITANDVLSLFGIVATDVFSKITEYIARKESAGIISLIHNLLDKGNDLQELLNGYLDYLRNLLLLKNNVPLPELPDNIKNEMLAVNKQFSEDSLIYFLSVLIKAKTDIKYSNNPILIAELAFIKLTKMEDMVSLTDALKNWKNAPAAQPVIKEQRNLPKQAPAQHSVKEETPVFHQFKEFNAEVFAQTKEDLYNRLLKVKPVSTNYLKKAVPEKIDKDRIYYSVEDKNGLKWLNGDNTNLNQLFSKYYNLPITIIFREGEAKEQVPVQNKKMNIEDINREYPELANIIKETNATFSFVKETDNK